MPLQPFNSVGGFSVGTGNALVIDSSGGFSGATATFRTVAASNIVNSVNGRTGNVGFPLASSSITGVASFGNEFIVSAAGAVSLTGNYVRSFNGSTGAVVYAPPLATTAITGAASFNNVHFTVATTGHVSLASAYQVTGDTVVAGTNITISRSGNSVTVNSGGGGSVPLATTSITGVASFNPSDFVVSATGNVSLTDVFTGGVTCSAAVSVAGTLTAGSLFVSQGVTFDSRASLVGGATAANLFVGAGTTLNSSLYVDGNSTLGGATANTITLPSGQVVKTYLSTRTSTSEFVLASELMAGYSSADIVIQAEYYIGGGGGTNALQSTRILLVVNPVGAAVKHVQYGNVFIGATCASYDVDTDGTNIWRMKVTPTAASGISPCDFRAYAILSPNIGGLGA